ncbi:hypothetical protein Noda2021_12450 [Candidatus Dependentiae bacterium Noda2021]|nr:hypothetical protein Noda2021_12450 [Candidatus Dependentiae bacterium Noda2021]
MKKLMFISFFLCSFALGSEQPSANLSHAQAAQLLANFAKLPEEIKGVVFPEYCPELKALVYLKPLPDASEDNTKNEENYYWKTLLKPAKKVFQHWNLSYSFLKNKKPYFLYHPYPANKTKLRRLGPNKNNILLLDHFLYDYSDDCKQFPYLRAAHKQQPRSDIMVSSNAQDLKNKYLCEQFFTCIHPTKNIIVGLDKDVAHAQKRITLTHYDSYNKKVEIKMIDTPEYFEILSFDKAKLDSEALWAIDRNRKLWHLTKNHEGYASSLCNMSDVYSLSQSSVYPNLLLINGTHLYKVDNTKLTRLKTFEHQTTFTDDNMSLEQGYDVPTKKEHAIIIKPLKSVLKKARSHHLSEKIVKLKTQILHVHQVGKALT